MKSKLVLLLSRVPSKLDKGDKLRAFYRTYDIIFDDVYDTMEDEDFINIGVFPPSEDLHHVATYVKSTNKYTIDHQELRNSLESFPYRP